MNLAKFDPPAQAEAPAERRDLSQLIAKFRRHVRLFAAVALVVLAAVVLVTFQQTPLYSATARVMIDTRKHDVTNIDEVLSGLPADSSVVDTEVEVLKSRALAERVVKALNLDNDPEFDTTLRSKSFVQSVVEAPLAALSALTRPADGASAAGTANLRQLKEHEEVVDHVEKRLTIRRSGLTYVIDVGFESQDATKAALIANTFADRYLTQQLQDKYDATQQATQWLNERLAELEPQVRQSQAAVEQYKAQHGLLASVGSSLTEQEISNLNTQLAQAQADQAERESRLTTAQKQIAGGSTGEDFSGALASETIKELRTQKAAISAKVADLQTKYGPRYPEIQSAQRQLTDIDTQIQQEVSRQVSSLQAEAEVSRGRTASIQASISQAKGTLVSNNAASVELADLQRKADAASALYNSLLNRAEQTSTAQGNEQSDAQVVARATLADKPSSPNKPLSLTLGLLLALASGLGAVFLVEALDNGLATSEDVERLLGVPHLGAIPRLDSTIDGKASAIPPERYVVEKPLSAFGEAFRSLRASILFSKVDAPVKVVVLTSSLPAEGKTTTAFCLARSAAMSGINVVVVDCDLRRRNINRMLNAEPAVGLVEVLQGKAQLDEALVRDEASGASVLPLSNSDQTPKDLFGSLAMDRLIGVLRDRFELVLMDTAPVMAIADTRILASKADVVVFLVQWRKTPRKAIEKSLSLLNSAGADIAGVALTLVDARQQAKYGYGDSGYYYGSYQKYYTQ